MRIVKGMINVVNEDKDTSFGAYAVQSNFRSNQRGPHINGSNMGYE